MFYYNTRYHFKLHDQSPDNIPGGIIAASAMARPQLSRRLRKTLKSFPYLQHRLFDPQLYLADIDEQVAGNVVVKLGTYPWFRCSHVDYESDQGNGGVKEWKDAQAQNIRDSWQRTVATEAADIGASVRSAVETQQAFGCEAIILPSPMTRVPGDYSVESQWIDAGIEACQDLRVAVPVYATIAIADTALRQLTPTQSPFLQSVSAQIAARRQLAGAYIVLAQDTEDNYACKTPDTLLSLLLLTDDLTRGAGREVIVNYMGTFGAVAMAAGAKIWSSGFYRSQRRLRTSDMDDSEGRQYPRYYSVGLLGDVGVEEELDLVSADNCRDRVLASSPSAARLNEVLRRGGKVNDVVEWQYRQTNVTAAASHYNSLMHQLGVALDGVAPDRRIDVVNRLLAHARRQAEAVQVAIGANGRRTSGATEVAVQRIWLEVFERWRALAGL